jgi:hypothetical protein
MALTRKGKFGALILVLAVAGAAFYFAQSRGLIGRKQADAQVDITAPAQPPAVETPTQPPVAVQQPQETPPAPQTDAPVQQTPQANLQPPSTGASDDKGVQFLLNQGKSQ